MPMSSARVLDLVTQRHIDINRHQLDEVSIPSCRMIMIMLKKDMYKCSVYSFKCCAYLKTLNMSRRAVQLLHVYLIACLFLVENAPPCGSAA